jgi:hypothetical protein
MELEVGMQQVESERDYVRVTEQENSRLRAFLCLTIYFFKWKSRAATATLQDERQKYETQRIVIFQQLRQMRETVAFANEQEAGVLHAALVRGQEVSENLYFLRDRMAQLTTSNTARPHRLQRTLSSDSMESTRQRTSSTTKDDKKTSSGDSNSLAKKSQSSKKQPHE